MSIPLIYDIVADMQAALQGISTASGYNFDVLSTSVMIDPKNINTMPVSETPLLVLGHRVEPVSRDFTGSRPVSVKERWRITIEAIVDVENDLDDTSKKLMARAQFAQDVERALTADPQRGLKALYTYVGQDSAYPDVDNQNRFYMEIPVEVLVQRVYGVS